MKKYLNIIERIGMALLFLGVILGHAVSMPTGAISVIIGLVLWVATVVYKAIKWNEYLHENIINIYIMIFTIIIMIIGLLSIAGK